MKSESIKALLLSNSTMPGQSFFTWPRPYVLEFLRGKKEILFIPYAAVTLSMDDYAAKVRDVFDEMGFQVKSLHEVREKSEGIMNTDAIVTGGGNTFALLHRLQQEGLMNVIREQVLAGKPYVGWSAGANLGAPTIMTTNDMPVAWPSSPEALALVPFQINPHYHELKFEGQGGETRKERLEEFVEMNPEKFVVGLPEGMLLERDGDKLMLKGNGVAKRYVKGKTIESLESGDLSHLLV